jgi:hypothetical protein
MLSIHIWAVLAAAVASFILGFLFHGPVSGRLWMKLADIHPTGNEKFSDMIPQMFWNLVVNIITAYVMAMIFALVFTSPLMGPATWFKGVIMGFWLWLGFLVTSSAIGVIWMKQKKSLWIFEAVCSLIVMAVMGIILVVL